VSSNAVTGLLTILEAEERLYLEMRDLLQRERELIAVLDAAGVEEVVREKENLAEEGSLLEESRLEVSVLLAKELGIFEEPPTLSAICDVLGEAGSELGEAHSRLTALAGAVQELLAANASFAGDALDRVQGTLHLLGRLLPETPTYLPSGVTNSPNRAGRLVRQSA
jgi:hypothetical protein